MVGNEELLNIPFDQYSRQFQVAELANKLRKKNETFKILDVGGYKGKTAEFFPNDEVTVLDVYDVQDPHYIKGSGLSLPFDENSFDLVVNFDVLEHIPKKDRFTFIDECARVASRAFFICAPHKTSQNEYAEERLNDIYRVLHQKDHVWLEEHIENTLPDMPVLKAHLEKQGYFVSEFTSNDTLVWLLMQSVIFFNSKFSHAAPVVQEINRYYNTTFPYDGTLSEKESYRLILCCVHDKNDQELLKKYSKNKPLSFDDKLKVVQKILEYHVELLNKIEKEKASYRDHHEQAKLRIKELETQNQDLTKEIEHLRKTLFSRLSDTTKRGIHRITKRDK